MEHDMVEERRQNRSTNSGDALRLQLEASAKRAGFSSLALAEGNGLVVASAGEPAETEEVAALSPLFAASCELWHGTVATEGGEKLLTIAAVRSSAGPLFLTAVGGRRQEIVPELVRSGQGVCRILA
jgi:hypothetical protein